MNHDMKNSFGKMEEPSSEPPLFESLRSPTASTNVLAGTNKRSSISTESSEGSMGDEPATKKPRIVSASDYWTKDHSQQIEDIKLQEMLRYLRASRAFYDLQYQMKRPSAILKLKPNPFGFRPNSTFDALAALTSPLRSRQVLDDWTPLEIGTFEEAFDRFGKNFHAIAGHLKNKTAHEAIEFYYIWKKYRRTGSESDDLPLDDDFLPEPDPGMSSEVYAFYVNLTRRQACIREYFDAARKLSGPVPPRHPHRIVSSSSVVSALGLRPPPGLRPTIQKNSLLRQSTVLDNWTPFEIRIFEAAIECFGKQFHLIAQQIETKNCAQVVAFYYVWKKDPQYRIVKNRWDKSDSRKNSPDATALDEATSTVVPDKTDASI